jgi:hypothetical protein
MKNCRWIFAVVPGPHFAIQAATVRNTRFGFLVLLAAAACLANVTRAEVINFNSVTNGIWYGPVYYREPYQLSDVYFAGPYLQPRLTARNPANGTTALKLPAAAAGTYIMLSIGYHAPFAFNSLDIVSLSGTLIVSDALSGAYYTNNGTTGRITLGSAFDNVTYVDFFVNGEVVIDNLNYTVLHHRPVAAIRVLNELKPSIIFPDDMPGHLDNDSSYSDFPGYKRFRHIVLTTTTNPVPFVVDASASDGHGEPLTYDWSYYLGGDDGDWYPLFGGAAFTSPCFTNQPPYLNNSTSRQMILHVKNAYFEDWLWFGVRVWTVEQATGVLLEWLDDHYDRARGPVQRRLLPTLREAQTQLHNGEMEAAVASLQKAKNQARFIFRYNPLVRRAVLDFSQQIIDVVSAEQP